MHIVSAEKFPTIGLNLDDNDIKNVQRLNDSLLVITTVAKEEPINKSGSSIYGMYVTSYARKRLMEFIVKLDPEQIIYREYFLILLYF